jgi:hypothetical protein
MSRSFWVIDFENMPIGILVFKAASITGPLQKDRKAPIKGLSFDAG